ncbi:hypothetical protein [Hydrogenophaga sp.]|uniref:hypothetical protein n=1 Tax=Hydrogenophaga sp. TaxID=1904254 RepID=UPI003F71382B
MAEILSRQKTTIAAGSKVLNSVHGTPKCLVFTSPAVAAWAQNDTFASGLKVPAGSRFLNACSVSHGAMATSVTVDVGIRGFTSGTVIDVDGIADAVSVAAAGRTALNNGSLMVDGLDSVTTEDAEVYVTVEGANPTDNIQMRFEIWYLPPG